MTRAQVIEYLESLNAPNGADVIEFVQETAWPNDNDDFWRWRSKAQITAMYFAYGT